MGRGKELSEFDKGGIIALKEWGIGDTEIARAQTHPTHHSDYRGQKIQRDGLCRE